jgi:hypothetical protein
MSIATILDLLQQFLGVALDEDKNNLKPSRVSKIDFSL